MNNAALARKHGKNSLFAELYADGARLEQLTGLASAAIAWK